LTKNNSTKSVFPDDIFSGFTAYGEGPASSDLIRTSKKWFDKADFGISINPLNQAAKSR
jgi:hypothetical protein